MTSSQARDASRRAHLTTSQQWRDQRKQEKTRTQHARETRPQGHGQKRQTTDRETTKPTTQSKRNDHNGERRGQRKGRDRKEREEEKRRGRSEETNRKEVIDIVSLENTKKLCSNLNFYVENTKYTTLSCEKNKGLIVKHPFQFFCHFL